MFRIRLKQLREERGYSQFAFAKKLGVAQSTVGNWESGIREPSFETIQKISEALNTTPSHLVGWDNDLSSETKKDNSEIASLVIRLRTDRLFLEAVKKIDKLEPVKIKSLLALL